MLILLQGSNLIRPDLTLQCRITPADGETLTRAVYVSPSRMKEWDVMYLIEEKVRLFTSSWLAFLVLRL